MITNAQRESWPGDVIIPDAVQRGLLIPSKVRTAKISAVETNTASLIGKVDRQTWLHVQSEIREALGL